jgi:hypothetical protein
MTDIAAPPDDPAERLKWARGLSRDFSSPQGRGAVSAAEIRAMARRTISELDPSVQSNLIEGVDVPATNYPVELNGSHVALRQRSGLVPEPCEFVLAKALP